MYSALKINGQKLYNLAREGKVVERKARKKTIYSFDIVKYEEGVLLFDVRCSKGTYVRTLCHDLGKKLDSYGVMTFLERVATGSFNLENGVMLQDLRKHGKDFLIENLVSIEDAISSFAKVVVGKELLDKIKHGVRINYVKYLKEKPLEGQMFRIYVEDVFVGIGQYNIETDKLLLTKLFI
jgi:tRNA pseudouridine55 synthase